MLIVCDDEHGVQTATVTQYLYSGQREDTITMFLQFYRGIYMICCARRV